MGKLKIFVCVHKPGFYLHSQFYQPIQLGKDSSAYNMNLLSDNTGDNISAKNPHFCELTAQYWIWKNLKDKVGYIGLCHYRRYFSISTESHVKVSRHVTEQEMLKYIDVDFKILEKCDVLLTSPITDAYSLHDMYCLKHITEDFDILEKTVKKLYPDYINSFKYVMDNTNSMHGCNMLIARSDIFNAYSEWLFTILFEVEKNVRISSYPYQARVFGFMAERLLNVYFFHNRKHWRIKSVPMLIVDGDMAANKTFLYHWLGTKILDTAFLGMQFIKKMQRKKYKDL